MPAIRKPTEILQINGAFQQNPQRKRPVGPKSNKPIGDPPSHLDADHKKVWRELISNAPHNALTSADRVLLELVVRLTVRMRSGKASTHDMPLLSSTLSKLGWTPADRSKVLAVKPDDDDDGLGFL